MMIDHVVLSLVVAGAFLFLCKRFVKVSSQFLNKKNKGSWCGSCKGCSGGCSSVVKQEK